MSSSESPKIKEDSNHQSPKLNAAASSISGDVKNRGWPKGKKRYPKSPGAPKQPLSGYVHFLNDRRETVRKETPDMSFADISKKLANEWSQLGQDEKQRYHERAERDKERYSREFQEYQLTDAYKDFIAQQEAAKNSNGETKPTPPSNKKPKKSKKKENDSAAQLNNEDSRSSAVSSSSTVDIPIFRDEFLELNKVRETELRTLKKTVNEFEEQTAVLQKHVDNMKTAVTKLEKDVALTQENNDILEKQYQGLQKLVLAHFSHIQVPNLPGSVVNQDNIEEYVAKLLELIQQGNCNPSLKELVRKTTSNMDLSLAMPHT